MLHIWESLNTWHAATWESFGTCDHGNMWYVLHMKRLQACGMLNMRKLRNILHKRKLDSMTCCTWEYHCMWYAAHEKLKNLWNDPLGPNWEFSVPKEDLEIVTCCTCDMRKARSSLVLMARHVRRSGENQGGWVKLAVKSHYWEFTQDSWGSEWVRKAVNSHVWLSHP